MPLIGLMINRIFVKNVATVQARERDAVLTIDKISVMMP
jgi:superfamily I DNA and/or RNA helicase